MRREEKAYRPQREPLHHEYTKAYNRLFIISENIDRIGPFFKYLRLQPEKQSRFYLTAIAERRMIGQRAPL